MKDRKDDKFLKFAPVLCGAVIVLFALLWTRFLLLPPKESAVLSPEKGRRVKLVLYEAGNGIPLSDVRVVIPETGECGVYGNGDYLFIEKEVAKITLLLYKDGYCDTAVFHLPLTEGSVKTARYALYKNDGSMPYVVYCEAPESADILALLAAWKTQ